MWNDTDIPLGYLITFRCYGTWLHGDERGATDRFHKRYNRRIFPEAIAGETSATLYLSRNQLPSMRRSELASNARSVTFVLIDTGSCTR